MISESGTSLLDVETLFGKFHFSHDSAPLQPGASELTFNRSTLRPEQLG